jgi:heme exporter protein D
MQNYKNHTRLSWTYHGLTLLAILALLVGSVVNLVHSTESNKYSASLLVLASLILFSLYAHTRVFALRAQDRAIRAEENLRHLALTGKMLDQRLKLGQVVALRFASDEEFPSLAQKAAEGNLSNKEIKKQITHWREDRHRV